MTVAPNMANRAQASTSRPAPYLKMQQQKRARQIVALVPKTGAKSDLEDNDSSADELQCYPQTHQMHSDSSSPAPSLPSSLERLNLLDSDEDEVVLASTSLHPFLQPSLSISASSPSGLSPKGSTVSQLSHASNHSNLALQRPSAVSPSILTISSPVPSPRDTALTNYEQAPSPLCVPSPSTGTRSKKAKVVITKKKVIKPKKLALNWSCKKFTGSAEIEDVLFEDSNDGFSPFEYFKLFFSDDIVLLITQQTNLYSTQMNGTSINVSENDIKDFLAIIVLMGVVKLPAYTDYWSTRCRYEHVAGVMPLKKFQLIRRYIHFNDNLKDDGDRYYKIRPVFQRIRTNCLKVEEEARFSIDEMMVPHKGTRAGSRKQYIKNKPKKWGYKIFVRAGVSGIVYDFLVYGGEDTFRFHKFSDEENSMGLGSKVVLALAQSIRQPACKVLCFDNFFTSIELLQYLRHEYGIFALGTIRQNRVRGAEQKLPSDKNLKKRGRGSYAQVVCNKNKIVVVKWLDSKCVTVASSYLEARPVQVVLRYKKEEKRKVPVPCPNLIKEYNTNMGGVDLADMLIALYRTPFRGHRWYLPLFSQMIDICRNNAWLLYRRDFDKARRFNTFANISYETNKTKRMSLKQFRLEIYESLLKVERAASVRKLSTDAVAFIKNPTSERPPDAIRYDQVGHIPTFTSKGRCKNCVKGQTKFFCQKCNVRLCLVPERNCYQNYHTK